MPLVINVPTSGGLSVPMALASPGADILRVSTVPGGAPVLDLADGNSYSYLSDTLTVNTTGQSATQGLPIDSGASAISASDERYGGGVVDFDRRANGILQWTAVVMSTQAQTIVQLIGQLAAEIERADPPRTRFFEWRRAGAIQSLWYERRGPGVWNITERWESGEIALVTVEVPVAPVAYGPPVTTGLAQQAVPNTWTLSNPGGTLPALLDVQCQTAAQLDWALIAGHGGPFGVFEAESMTLTGGWASGADATARGGNLITVTNPANNAVYSATASFDPSQAQLDSLQYETDVALEVWVRMKISPGTLAVQAQLSAQTPDAALTVYSLEFGQTGNRLATRTTAQWSLYRLGTLRIPPDPGNWLVKAQFTISATGGTQLQMDYAIIAPARKRASGPTGVPNDSTYPSFTPTASTYYKTIRSDLSGRGGTTSPPSHFERGLAGAPLRVPVTTSPKLLIAASSAVPDDTLPGGAADTLGPLVTPTVTVTPRYLLADAS